ncbi:hypothetical protein, partial [Micromonospora parastrephiae]|uniref:hypothetical protein n=1 Tax=Micromonospora parastrephiae TaxID=2806101 RepID=UPI001EE463A7
MPAPYAVRCSTSAGVPRPVSASCTRRNPATAAGQPNSSARARAARRRCRLRPGRQAAHRLGLDTPAR